MNGNLRGILALASALLAASAGASMAQELDAALAQAYSSNPTLAAARAQMRAIDEAVPQALSGWRPTVALDGNLGKEWNHDHSAINFDRNHEPKSGGIFVTQPLFSGFATVKGRDAAEQQVLAGRERLTDFEQQVLLAGVQAYMQVVRDRALVELNKSNENVIAEQLDATRKRFEVGEVTKTDVAQAEARLQGATAERVASEGTLAASIATYQQIIGETPGSLSMPAADMQMPSSLEETVALSQNAPSVLAAQYDERAALLGIDVAFADMLPDLSVEGSWFYDDEINSEFDRSDTGAVMLRLTVPLYQAGAPDSRVRQAKQTHQQSRALIDEARRAAEQVAQDSWQFFETSQARINAFTEQVRATEIALEGVKQESLVGARTVLDVLNAELEALQAKVSLVAAQTDLVVAKYRVVSAVGQLTAASLNLDVTLYDPKVYYDRVRDKFIGTGTGE
jgi:TolC family type I secretion outer membrane protein